MRTPAEIADALSAFAHRSANPTRELEALLFEAAQALRSQPTVTDAMVRAALKEWWEHIPGTDAHLRMRHALTAALTGETA